MGERGGEREEEGRGWLKNCFVSGKKILLKKISGILFGCLLDLAGWIQFPVFMLSVCLYVVIVAL